MADPNEQQKQWAKIVAKAWHDEDYKQRLLTDPVSVLKEEGFNLPEGVEFKCVEATPEQVWLVLPPKPNGEGKESISDDELDGVSGGFTVYGGGYGTQYPYGPYPRVGDKDEDKDKDSGGGSGMTRGELEYRLTRPDRR